MNVPLGLIYHQQARRRHPLASTVLSVASPRHQELEPVLTALQATTRLTRVRRAAMHVQVANTWTRPVPQLRAVTIALWALVRLLDRRIAPFAEQANTKTPRVSRVVLHVPAASIRRLLLQSPRRPAVTV